MAALAFLSSSLAVLAFLLVPASSRADSRFSVNRGMGGIALGMTASEVRERLGAPTRIDAGPDFTAWSYRRPSFEVTLKPGVVTLHTASPSIRGPRAIGVGTRERRLKAVLGRRLRCRSARGRGFCVIGSFATQAVAAPCSICGASA